MPREDPRANSDGARRKAAAPVIAEGDSQTGPPVGILAGHNAWTVSASGCNFAFVLLIGGGAAWWFAHAKSRLRCTFTARAVPANDVALSPDGAPWRWSPIQTKQISTSSGQQGGGRGQTPVPEQRGLSSLLVADGRSSGSFANESSEGRAFGRTSAGVGDAPTVAGHLERGRNNPFFAQCVHGNIPVVVLCGNPSK